MALTTLLEQINGFSYWLDLWMNLVEACSPKELLGRASLHSPDLLDLWVSTLHMLLCKTYFL